MYLVLNRKFIPQTELRSSVYGYPPGLLLIMFPGAQELLPVSVKDVGCRSRFDPSVGLTRLYLLRLNTRFRVGGRSRLDPSLRLTRQYLF